MSDDFFTIANRLRRKGVPFATASVVRAEKPTSGQPGDKAIVTLDGQMQGWVGGSCAQETVVQQALEALRLNSSRLIRLSPSEADGEPRSGLIDLPMTCFSGGTMEIYIEPHQPSPHLLIVGDLPVAQTLARLGRGMGYRVAGVAPGADARTFPDADEVIPEVAGLAVYVTPMTFVLVATHGHYDEEALQVALEAGAPYVGLVASRKRAAAVLENLRARGVDREQLDRIRSPAGLDIGARGGDEIALSILAEVVQMYRAREEIDWSSDGSGGGVATGDVGGEGSTGGVVPSVAETAIDPICGMTVRTAGAAHIRDYEGQRYYFCCAGCGEKFMARPEIWAGVTSTG